MIFESEVVYLALATAVPLVSTTSTHKLCGPLVTPLALWYIFWQFTVDPTISTLIYHQPIPIILFIIITLNHIAQLQTSLKNILIQSNFDHLNHYNSNYFIDQIFINSLVNLQGQKKLKYNNCFSGFFIVKSKSIFL